MHAELSQAYQDAGMLAEAIAELERGVHLCPNFADLRTRLAVLYRDAGQVTRAREQLELARNANPTYAQARVLLGVMMLSAGELESAEAEFQTVLSQDADNKGAQMYLKLARSRIASSERPPT
jgi:tetratricopeptide (TPR) repeat protein